MIRLQKGKIMLLASLAAWIIFNVPIGFMHPPATSCLVYNQSGFYIQTPKALKMGNRVKRGLGDDGGFSLPEAPFNTPNLYDDEKTWTAPKALTYTGKLPNIIYNHHKEQ